MVTDRMIVNFEQFILYDYLWQYLNAITVNLQVVHSYNWDYIVDDPTTETNLRDEVFTVCVHPVF